MKTDTQSRPTTEQLRAELERLSRRRGGAVFGKILLILLLLLVICVALVIIFIPGYVIYGDSMSPSLAESDIVLAWPYSEPAVGDIIAFLENEENRKAINAGLSLATTVKTLWIPEMSL